MDKEKAIISDGLCILAPLFNERCNYPNSLIGKEKAIRNDGFLLFCSPYASKLQHFQNRLNLESFLLVNLLSLSCV
jgi:hypothetical protein